MQTCFFVYYVYHNCCVDEVSLNLRHVQITKRVIEYFHSLEAS
jgi:hypothetical protein